MLVKNKNTGVEWAVSEAHAASLIKTGDYEKVEVKPKPKPRAKATKTESGD
ncbi:hypothetical protein ACFSY7_08150 [Kurthia populi]|uniref:Uncharacterized protein n=1 Tax=Kurthia populi TaxID=1562132 RepID=A0ABW5XZF4_9BACL